MTRPCSPTTSALGSSLAALALSALGALGCSWSFKAGGDATAEAGKPATSADAPASKPTKKPIAKPDPSEPDEPAPSEPTEEAGPTRLPPADEPPPVVEPRLTAVCRVEDPSLEAICHRALDPIAADDVEAWVAQLGEGVVLTRPIPGEALQRMQGPQAVRDAATDAGGLRALLHLRPTDRVVGTLANDCRRCRRAFVAFEANTRSGTLVVTVEATQPPKISSVEVASRVRRRPLPPWLQPKPTPVPEKAPTTLVPPAKVEPAPSTEIVAPEPKRNKKVEIAAPENKAEP